ncbi:hypothetical protein [Erythrobacter sp. R86502]|uniref:hypothetical protein n=1 Tax=Erythrobacter sp. R86502 TaxID=3093846 RepID=UPI0036D35C08
MIPLLSDLTAAASAPPPGAVLPQPGETGQTGLDFSGLLSAAMPPPPPQPQALSGAGAMHSAPSGVAPSALVPATNPAMPGGNTLPESGMSLPQSLPLSGATVPTAEASLPAADHRPTLLFTIAPVPDQIAAVPATRPFPEAALADQHPPADIAPEAAPQTPIPAQVEPEAPLADPAPASELETEPDTATPSLAVAPPVLPDPRVAAAGAILPAPSSPNRRTEPLTSARVPGQHTALMTPSANVPLPARVNLAADMTGDIPSAMPLSEPGAALLPAPPVAAPEGSAPTAPAQAGAPLSAAVAVQQDAISDAGRSVGGRPLGPQIESAISQVGDLREAMRTARPEMTVRHAEFGVVSVRIEAGGAQDWRAVLASRDPGFVPAIQAALGDRAMMMAASASADNGTPAGHHGANQNGTSDSRYGASPSGGQAGSQPYLGQSSDRDGNAAPDHRRTSTAAALAASAEDEGDAGGSTAGHARGMFA